MARLAKLLLHASKALGIYVDERDVPAVLGQHLGGDSSNPSRTAGAGDDRGTQLRQPK